MSDVCPDLLQFANRSFIFQQLPEEIELVWDDSVAPEAAVDLDAPHVSSGTALKHFFLGFSFFIALYATIKFSEPEKRSPVASKSAVLPKNGFLMDVGLASEEEAHEDEEQA